jgi:hypothetical protein
MGFDYFAKIFEINHKLSPNLSGPVQMINYKKEKLAKQEVVKQVEVEVEADKEIAPLTL